MLDQTRIASVSPVASRADRRAFLRLPYDLYRGQPAWRPPLRIERAAQISPRMNAQMSDVDAALFLAHRGREVVGRIASFTHTRHHETHDPKQGHFGFLDSVDDAGVVRDLLSAMEADQRHRGMSRVVGPAQWSVNEEVGLLIDGFEHSNVILTPYGRPYYQHHVEACGYTKDVDLLCYQADLAAGRPRPRSVQRLIEAARRSPRIRVRNLDKTNFQSEVATALEIYEDAWSENWNALPYTPAQAEALAKELRPLMADGSFMFAEVDGVPVAFGVVLPDLNEAIRHLDGRLRPIGITRAIRDIAKGRVKQGRLPLMGMRREMQKTRVGVTAMTLMCEELFTAAEARGFTHLELGWILEGNSAVIQVIEQVKAEPYKRYRMYGKSL